MRYPGLVPVEPTLEATAIDGETEAGTEAATPKALAEIKAASSGSGTGLAEARPTGWGTAAGPQRSAAEVLDKSDQSRSRMFHLFGIIAPLGAVAMSLWIGGDPLARALFWAGIGLLCAANGVLFWMTGKVERFRPVPVGILWIVATIGVLPAVYYFGPFSA